MLVMLGCGVFFTGCATVYQKMDPNLFYKRDIGIEINGKKYDGVVTIPHEQKYQLKLYPKGKLDLVLVRSCHRDETSEDIGSSGFLGLGGNKEFKYEFDPTPGMEDVPWGCPLRVEAYEAEKGRHSWALITREHPDMKLQATVFCNAEIRHMNGVQSCQARAGTIQKIVFADKKIQFAPVRSLKLKGELEPYDADCGAMIGSGGLYEIIPGPGECVYSMRNEKNERGRFYMVGYEGVNVRSGK